MSEITSGTNGGDTGASGVRRKLARNAEHIPVSTKGHEAIVNAVAKGNAALAERLLFEHVIASRARLHAALREPVPARPRRASA